MSAAISLPRSTPAVQGVDVRAIQAFIDRVDGTITHLHSFMLMRHGNVIAEGWWSPYAPERKHMLFSLSKSFTSTAIGMAVNEGLLSVHDKVASFFPDELPASISDNLAAMRVWDLLTMTAGHATDSTMTVTRAPDGNWVRAFFTHPVEHAPGTRFVYNSGATYMLSAILQKLTGQRLVDYLQPRLFAPLGIVDPVWDQDPRGIDVGGWGLNITTEDIAKFGQLYLQEGNWNGAQLIPAAWVADATGKRVSNGPDPKTDWEQGYGYQFWRCQHNAYRGDGAFGQYCVVLPEQDAVLAITSGLPDMQAVLTAVWEILLPGFAADALPADAAGEAVLKQRLASLSMPLAPGAAANQLATAIDGKTYALSDNPAGVTGARIDGRADGLSLTLRTTRGDDVIDCGFGAWHESRIRYTIERPRLADTPPPATLVMSSAGWTDTGTLTIMLVMAETPFVRTHELRFTDGGGGVRIDTRMNVGFTPPEPLIITGRVE
jgi:CubicO group peptidase (beta-lactamase class C family)